MERAFEVRSSWSTKKSVFGFLQYIVCAIPQVTGGGVNVGKVFGLIIRNDAVGEGGGRADDEIELGEVPGFDCLRELVEVQVMIETKLRMENGEWRM